LEELAGVGVAAMEATLVRIAAMMVVKFFIVAVKDGRYLR